MSAETCGLTVGCTQMRYHCGRCARRVKYRCDACHQLEYQTQEQRNGVWKEPRAFRHANCGAGHGGMCRVEAT